MSTELEAKLAVESHDAVRASLRECGAQHASTVIETNYILDHPDQSLRANGCALRVRANRLLYGECASATLTYKGPAQASKYKSREEVEVAVGDADMTLRILELMGCAVLLIFQKRRETWYLDSCHVVLDELPFIGSFVEIEGPDESAIAAVQSQLGLAKLPHESASYVWMLDEACRQRGIDPPRATFESPAA